LPWLPSNFLIYFHFRLFLDWTSSASSLLLSLAEFLL
jgi:hypothetical protein